MQTGLDPFRFVIIAVAGWMNQHQQHAIDYLLEENRVLREQIGTRRIRFSDASGWAECSTTTIVKRRD